MLGMLILFASLANLHANNDLLYMCKAKKHDRAEMFFIASLQTLHFPCIARCKHPKIPCYLILGTCFMLSCFHVINLHGLPCAVVIVERSIGGMLHAYKLASYITK